MIGQQGRVTGIDGQLARVTLGGQSGCPNCDAGKGCGAGLFGRLLKRRNVEVELANTQEADLGQSVWIGIPERRFLGLVGHLYAIPLLAGLAGAVAAFLLTTNWIVSGPVTDGITLFAGLAAAWVASRISRRSLPTHVNGLSLRMLDASDGNLECRPDERY